jgi:hypothetical protein
MELSTLPWQEGKNWLRRANLENSRSNKTQNYQSYAQSGIDMKQSVEADPPPAEGKIVALTQKELRHLKGSRFTSGKKSCIVKGSNQPVRTTAWWRGESRSWGKAALDRADAQTWTLGRPKEPLVGSHIISRKKKLDRVDNLDFSLLEMNPTLTKGKRAFINGQQLLKGEKQDDDNIQAEDKAYAQTPQPGL